MGYCGPRGIPLSTFLAWPQSDQDAALQWQADENQRCPSCGTHPDDWRESRDYAHAHMKWCGGCERVRQVADSEEAKNARRGTRIALAAGSAASCPQCNPT